MSEFADRVFIDAEDMAQFLAPVQTPTIDPETLAELRKRLPLLKQRAEVAEMAVKRARLALPVTERNAVKARKRYEAVRLTVEGCK